MAPIPNEIVETLRLLRDKLNTVLEVKRIILFGSYAKGSYNENSDIDVCVIAEKVKNSAIAMLKIAPKTAQVDTRIETVVFSEEDFLSENFGIIGEIKRTGVEIQ